MLAASALAALLAVALVLVGRAERDHERAGMLDGIDAVRAAIGPNLSHPGPTDFVQDHGVSCLLYAAGARSYALELCIDARGRVVEAVDRRGLTAHFYSIVSEPQHARFTIDPTLVAALIDRLGREHPSR